MVEFQAAHMQSMEDKINRIIMIKVGDSPKQTDPTIKAHLRSATYLTWGEANFWNKLLYALPTTSDERNLFHEI